MSDGTLDEAYERLHRTGPEYQGWLSNHGPMAVEALVRHGHQARVHRWLDGYLGRLDELPRGLHPIDDWQSALGDPKRAGDWLAYFDRQLREHQWRAVLGTWWPRLLPGIAAGATHGVIRVGHAVRALDGDGENWQRLTELGQALGYWAARWQPIPGTDRLLTGDRDRPGSDDIDVAAALADLPGSTTRAGRPGSVGPAARRTRWQPALTTVRPREPGRGGARAHHPRAPGQPGLPALRARRAGHAGARGHRADRSAAYPAGTGPWVVGAELRRGLGRDGGHDLGVRPGGRHRATDRDPAPRRRCSPARPGTATNTW
ncbi:questin oxidase family protein [Micromonospora sp. M12]